MGLRKLTQWEETVAKQEQKQSRLMSVAIVCVIAMCAVLWLVQDKLYGDVVNTGTGAYISSAIGQARLPMAVALSAWPSGFLCEVQQGKHGQRHRKNGRNSRWLLLVFSLFW